MENLTFKRIKSFNSLNIHGLLCIIIVALLSWMQRKLFKIIIRRVFFQRRKKQVYTMLKIINKFYVLTIKYHNITETK